ncbi:Nonsense-mediated mRNA decay protein 5, partial [Coemansia sp. RSA 551]
MYRFDFNFSDVSRADDNNLRAADIDYESDGEDSDTSDTQAWASLDRRLLHRISTFLPRQRDLRTFCLVNKDWAQAAAPQLWAYPQFSEPEQLAGFLRTVSARPQVYGPHIRGIRFTLNSHYDRHLVSPFYHDGDESADAELPTLLEVAQGKHVLSTDPTLLRSLLHGSDLTSPPLAFKFARACAPIDSLSMYGFRLRDKHVVNELMRWRLRDIEIIGMPRKQLANLGYLLHNLRSLRSLRLESDSPLPTDTWGPLALRLPALRQLRVWAPDIAASRLVRSLAVAPKQLQVLHLVGTGGDAGDDLVELIMQGSPQLQSLVVYGANITAQSAYTALTLGHNLTHLELMRDGPELSDIPTRAPDAVPIVTAASLNTLSLRNLAVDDALIAATALVATQLRTLFICGAPCLGGGSVGALLNASTRLVALGLHDCPLLTEDALYGLVSGPSADQLRVLLVRQCRMQSDGVERALPALTHLKHFSIIGTETVQQLFTYGFEEPAPAAEDEPILPPTISRSFKTTYPPDHYFCKSDPEVAAVSSDVARDIAASAAVPVPQTPRSAWNTYSTKRFVPGLLAFASSGAAYASRARANTISAEDQVPGAGDAHSSQHRLRSISELPSSVAPITIHDGSDYAPSPQSEHSADLSPMDRAVSPDLVPVASEDTTRGLNLVSDVEETTAHAEEEPTTESDADASSAAVVTGVVGAALAAGAAIIALNATEDTSADAENSVDAEEPAADLDARSVEEAIAEAVADSIAESSDEPVARSIGDVVIDPQAESVEGVESAAEPAVELELDPANEQPAPIDSLDEAAAPAKEEPVAEAPVALVDEPVNAAVEEPAPVVDETVAPVQEDVASVSESPAPTEEPAAVDGSATVADEPTTEEVTEEPVVSAEDPAVVSDVADDKSREIEVPTALEEAPAKSAEESTAVNEELAVEDPAVAAIIEEPAPASELVAEEVPSAAGDPVTIVEVPAVIDDSPVSDAEVTESTAPVVDEAVPRALDEIVMPSAEVDAEPTEDAAAPAEEPVVEEAVQDEAPEDVVSKSAEPAAEEVNGVTLPVEEALVTAEAELPIESVDEPVALEAVVDETSIAVASSNDDIAPTESIVEPAEDAAVDNSDYPAAAGEDSAPIARELVVDASISPETAEDPVTVVSEQDTVIPVSEPIDDSAVVDDAAGVVESPAVPTEALVEVAEEPTLASSDEPSMTATEET